MGKRNKDQVRNGVGAVPAAKVLVAYYSWSGVTEKAAHQIASAVHGDTYRIVPETPYSAVYGLCVAKAGVERASDARPAIAGKLPDLRKYDKVAVGFPIWWFSCPMIIFTFLEQAGLKDKPVYLFCTSKISGPRNSAGDVRQKLRSLTIKGECLDAAKAGSLSDEAIKAWLEIE